MPDFPTGLPDIPDANVSETLSVMHAGAGHVPGTNRILLNVLALAAKVGIGSSTPGAAAGLLRRTGSGSSAWGPVQAGDYAPLSIGNADIATAAAIAVSKLAPGTAGYVLQSPTSGAAVWVPLSRRNLLINGDMRIAQRLGPTGTAAVGVDFTYQTADRWKTLQNTGTVWNVFSHASVPIPGSSRSLLFNSGGNSAKGGAIQILESDDTIPLRSSAVSVQAMLNVSAGIADVRWALLAWVGTADVVTDPVATWNADGTNPTLAASWSYLTAPANLSLTPGWGLRKLENVAVPANCNNLALMVWSEDSVQTASTDSWMFTDVQLELGAVCTAFERSPLALSLLLCQRYYQKTYPYNVAPGTVTPVGNISGQAGAAVAGSTLGTFLLLAHNGPHFGVQMRASPSVTLYSGTTGATGTILIGGAANRAGATPGAPSVAAYFDYIQVDATGAQAIADRSQIQLQATASAEL